MDEIRQMIDKIAANVDEVKKKHSAILSAPQTDDSELIRPDLFLELLNKQKKHTKNVNIRLHTCIWCASFGGMMKLSRANVALQPGKRSALHTGLQRFPHRLRQREIIRQALFFYDWSTKVIR